MNEDVDTLSITGDSENVDSDYAASDGDNGNESSDDKVEESCPILGTT